MAARSADALAMNGAAGSSLSGPGSLSLSDRAGPAARPAGLAGCSTAQAAGLA